MLARLLEVMRLVPGTFIVLLLWIATAAEAAPRDLAVIDAEIKTVSSQIDDYNLTVKANTAEIALLTELHEKYRSYLARIAAFEAEIQLHQDKYDKFYENDYYDSMAVEQKAMDDLRHQIALLKQFKARVFDRQTQKWIEVATEPDGVVMFHDTPLTDFAQLEKAAVAGQKTAGELGEERRRAEEKLAEAQKIVESLQKERAEAVAAQQETSADDQGGDNGAAPPPETGGPGLPVENLLGDWKHYDKDTVVRFYIVRTDNTGQPVLQGDFVREDLQDYDLDDPADRTLFKVVVRAKPRPGTPPDQEDYIAQLRLKQNGAPTWMQVYLRLRGEILGLVAEDGSDALTFTRVK